MEFAFLIKKDCRVFRQRWPLVRQASRDLLHETLLLEAAENGGSIEAATAQLELAFLGQRAAELGLGRLLLLLRVAGLGGQLVDVAGQPREFARVFGPVGA